MKTIILILSFSLPAILFGQANNETRETAIVTGQTGESFDQFCMSEATSYLSIPEQKRQGVVFAGKVSNKIDQGSYKDYGIELLENETQYFEIAGSDDVLVVKSLFVLRLNYKNSKK